MVKPHKVKQEMPVRWDTEFDMLNALAKLKQFLIVLFELPIYQGPVITTRQCNTIHSLVKMLFPCKIFMKRGQSGGEMASKCIFLIRRLFLDLKGLSIANMGGFKTELLQRLHEEELDCFARFHPLIMACYLNINFKGRFVQPEFLSESKDVLLADMCEAAVAFGDNTRPPADTTPDVVESVIEDSQPPIHDFDFLVTQLLQAERTPQRSQTLTVRIPPLKPGRRT